MADHWTVHRWWVPADVEGCFVEAWRALAEMLVAEGLTESVSLFADVDEPRVRWTPLRWPSRTAWRAWRADARHRAVEDAITALCDGARVHRTTTLLTSPHPDRDHRGSPRRHLLTHTTAEGDRGAPSPAPGPQ
jgi:heme-degrading monooxygenase HmoA